MFSRKDKVSFAIPTSHASKNVIPSILSSDISILGNIVSDGFIEVEGKIEGNITCQCATIRKLGSVHGDLVAESVHIDGQVYGLVKARHVRITETGRVKGMVMYETISIQDGAYIDGQCKNTEQHREAVDETMEIKLLTEKILENV